MTRAYQQAFRHLFDGTIERYDPWDAAHRTAGPQYPGTTMCSAFRTFQGSHSPTWPTTRACCTVPIPEAMAYLMLRPLLPDVLDDDMCGVTVNQVFPYAERVRQAFTAGDSPSDFPEEHYERTWPDRFQSEQLNQTGRRRLGLR